MQIPKFQNGYEINISAKTDTLEFTTDNSIRYEIYTGPGRKIIPGFVFTSDITYFGFYPTSKGKSRKDEKVMFTIMNFILDILEEKNAIVAYIYSAAGKKHNAREQYFNSLFNNHSKDYLYRTTFDMKEDGKAVIIYRADNVNFQAIQNLTAEEIITRMENKEEFDEYHR